MRKVIAGIACLTVITFAGVAVADDPDGTIQAARNLITQADSLIAAEIAKPPMTQTATVTQTQTVTVTGTTTPPPPPPTCTGTQVAAGSNLATAAANNPAGTTFCLAAGTYSISSSVSAQSGDVFQGAGRTQTFVMGNGVEDLLFDGSGFTLRSLDVGGAFAENACYATNTCLGRVARNTVTFDDVRCHDNAVACAGPGDLTMVNSECDRNGSAFAGPGSGNPVSASCLKTVRSGSLLVEGSNIHDNSWVGLWCDFCDGLNSTFVVRNSVIARNGGPGIFWEVSGGWTSGDSALVEGNTITGNNTTNHSQAAGVNCNDCADLEVRFNTFGAQVGGRAVFFQDGARAPWSGLPNVSIHDNTLNGDTLNCNFSGVTCSGNV